VQIRELDGILYTKRASKMAIVTDEGKTRLIVTGSDSFDDYGFMKRILIRLTFYFDDVVICTRAFKYWHGYRGEWTGAEFLAEKWAHSRKYLVARFHPDPKLKAGKAEASRDQEILDYAERAIVFLDKRGDLPTKRFIRLARRNGLKVKVIRFRSKR
jgi:hypothetical protein